MTTLSAKKMGVKKKSSTAQTLPLLLIALPGLIYLLINNYLPMFGVFLAFKDFSYIKGIFGSKWNGLDNFEFLFRTKDAWIMTRNTLLYNAAFIVLGTVFAIFVAILIHELGKKRRVKLFQASLMLPNLLSWVVVGFIVYAFLNADNGFMNKTVYKSLGLDPVSWYSYKDPWPLILIFVYLWKFVGTNSIIYVAGIAGMDKEIFEAAQLDGASKVKQILHITVPMLKPTVITLTLMAIGRIFYSDFGLFYQLPMNSGPLFGVTQTIDTYVYRGLSNVSNIGMASAASFYQSFVGFAVVLTSNLIVRRIDADNALF